MLQHIYMLQANFLGKLSDWVTGQFTNHPHLFHVAREEFDIGTHLKNGASPNTAAGLFSEWLVFDKHSSLFGDKTGLEYFTANNPLHLSNTDMDAYHDLQEFVVGFFEVADIKLGEHVVLKDLSGTLHTTYDVSASMSLARGQTTWARIASVRGICHMVGSTFFVLPFALDKGMKKVAANWKRDALDARIAAQWLYHKREESNKTAEAEDIPLSKEEGIKIFENALRDCGMEQMMTAATVERWATDLRTFPLGFPTKALFFLLPEDLSKTQQDRMMTALQQYLNNLPMERLKGKTPREARGTQDPKESRTLMDAFSYGDYQPDLHTALALMKAEKYGEAYTAFESLIKRLLSENVPIFTAFRMYTNAGACCVLDAARDRTLLGHELLRAALRLNPLYDFGIAQKKRLLDPTEDLSETPKEELFIAKMIRDSAADQGKKQYQKTVFHRYEDFIASCGITLTYQTDTTPTTFHSSNAARSEKVGRNDFCPCNSGKKYKKCCGR